ncbi:MAG: peroxidase [Actinomycetota bacterium]|nr:peroxidase [Actinomycetota bacterium]
MSGGAAAGDYDGDGWTDLYVTRLDGSGVLYRNDHGRFRDVTARTKLDVLHEPSNGAVWADVDNDGHLDLYVTTLAGRRFYLFHNDGRGHFTDETLARNAALRSDDPHVGFGIGVGDYDGDGYVDLFTTEWRSPELVPPGRASDQALLHNRGATAPGFFENVTKRAGVGLGQGAPAFGFAAAFADLDGDRRPDVFLASDFGTSRLFWNNGNGTFTDGTKTAAVSTDENGMGLTIADYDGDGEPDVFVSSVFDSTPFCDQGLCGHGTTGNRLYRNDGHRHFTDVTSRAGVRDGGWGWGAAFFDATNSGRLDLVQAGGVDYPWERQSFQYRSGPTFLWSNRGDGTFTNVATAAGMTTPGPGKGLLVFDYNRDGRLDVLITRDGSTPVLYENVGGAHNAWLTVRLRGTRSNREGLGAVVSLRKRAGDRPQVRLYDSVSHFLGQSDVAAHFGLGRVDGRVAEVRVQWPSGRVSVARDVGVDREILLVEP